MNNNEYREEITRIARENINKATDAGLGMYNFDLWLDKPIQGKTYPKNIILQTYPYKGNDYYGLVYLLCYYPLDKEEMNWEHEDYNFFELSEDEKEYVFNLFKNEMEKTNKPMETKLSAFVKKGISFEEKIQLIVSWEEDRASDGEYVYDLDCDEDACSWIRLYDARTLHKCRKIGRYWMGGWQFACNGLNEKGNSHKAWCIDEEHIKTFFTDENLLGEIEDRFKVWMYDNRNYDRAEAIESFSKIYGNLIDFEGYLNAKEPIKYKWVATSNDGSFQDDSIGEFDQLIDCYNNMRDHALNKMKWNTQFNEDFEDDSYIGYEVHFSKDKIVHESYSGTYLYKIIPSRDFSDSNDFWDKLMMEAIKNSLNK